MDEIGFIKAIHPGMILDILLLFSFLLTKKLNIFSGHKQIRLMWFLIILLAFHIPFARNNYFAFAQTMELLEYMPFILALIFYIDSFDRLRMFFSFWILLMFYLSIKGTMTHGIGGSSFLSDENDFALLMNTMLPFGIFLFIYEKQILKKLFYLLSSITAVLSVISSFSRGGFLGLVSVFVGVWLFSDKKMISLFVIFLLSICIYSYSDKISYFYTGQKYWDRMATATEFDQGTAGERMNSWKAGWEMFKDNPLGVGGRNFQIRFPEYQNNSFQKSMWGRKAHSLYIDLIAELGIIGVIIYVLILSNNLRDLFWIKKRLDFNNDDLRYSYYLSSAFLVSFIAYFSSGAFISVLYYPHYFYLTAMIVMLKALVQARIQ